MQYTSMQMKSFMKQGSVITHNNDCNNDTCVCNWGCMNVSVLHVFVQIITMHTSILQLNWMQHC